MKPNAFRITSAITAASLGLILASCAHHDAASVPMPPEPAPIVAAAPAAKAPPAFDPNAPYKPINLPNRTLEANLYIQTSAEYRALCFQAYDAMTNRVKELMANRPPGSRPAAVVLDLDETVLDNSAFQSFQELNGLEYDGRLWDEWERHPEATRLVPGAKEFLDTATQLGVNLLYVSNRVNAETTTAALVHNGLTVDEHHRLYLKENRISNKDSRRAAIREKYDILFLVGDNLADFSSEFTPAQNPKTVSDAAAAISERSAKVDANRAKFGTEWFVLPNPVYGEWQRLIQKHPRELLRSPETMTYPKGTTPLSPIPVPRQKN
ncbi:hypothetical protein IT570_01115 [Candidatus Sumerlaeota bacterium]|nr:hypothetical protein [Candidatus Sumerlaeota bacterium]